MRIVHLKEEKMSPTFTETELKSAASPPRTELRSREDDAAYQAYRILHVGFVAAPLIAGLDKFFHWLVNWNQYLAPAVAQLSPLGTPALMRLVGVIEVIAGVLVAVKPRIGAYVVAVWLLGIIV